MIDPFYSPDQERLRELVSLMFREESPLSTEDHRKLAPFVCMVREEHVEDTTPGKRGIRRVPYYVLNEMGRKLYRQWLGGRLDHLIRA